jgi:uncharacterized protein YndB with AHSA1/START domain
VTNDRTKTVSPTEATIVFSREFEAPAAAVFEAHTDPAQLAHWVGPRGTTMRLREFDARTGGAWSYVIEGLGATWAFHGSFHEVTPSRRIVQTFEYEDNPEQPNLDILTFADLPNGRSRLDGQSIYPSIAARDAMLDVDSGLDEDYERLDALLLTRATSPA